MTMRNTLPQAFADLGQHLEWALPTETQRLRKREGSTLAEIRVFYDAMLPRLDAVVEHFQQADRDAADGRPVDAERTSCSP